MTIIIVVGVIGVVVVVSRAILTRTHFARKRYVQNLRDHADQQMLLADEMPSSGMRLMILDEAALDRAEANRLEEEWGL